MTQLDQRSLCSLHVSPPNSQDRIEGKRRSLWSEIGPIDWSIDVVLQLAGAARRRSCGRHGRVHGFARRGRHLRPLLSQVLNQRINLLLWFDDSWCRFGFRRGGSSPWSKRRRRRALSQRRWSSMFTPEGRLRDEGVQMLKRVRSGVRNLMRFIYLFIFAAGALGIDLSCLWCRGLIRASELWSGLFCLECKSPEAFDVF